MQRVYKYSGRGASMVIEILSLKGSYVAFCGYRIFRDFSMAFGRCMGNPLPLYQRWPSNQFSRDWICLAYKKK